MTPLQNRAVQRKYILNSLSSHGKSPWAKKETVSVKNEMSQHDLCYVGQIPSNAINASHPSLRPPQNFKINTKFRIKPSGTWTTSEYHLSCHLVFRYHQLLLQKDAGQQLTLILFINKAYTAVQQVFISLNNVFINTVNKRFAKYTIATDQLLNKVYEKDETNSEHSRRLASALCVLSHKICTKSNNPVSIPLYPFYR